MPGKCRFGFRWKVKNVADYQAHLLAHGLSWLILPGCVRWPRCGPFFSATGVLVHFDSGTVQHKCCLIDYILLDQIHTPAFVHARNRLYTLCQGPNRSGKSRQGMPVFSQYTIALSISRLLLPGRPPCGFRSGGSKSFILFHCASFNSCLFMSLEHLTKPDK